MFRPEPPHTNDAFRRELRRLSWGLIVYLLLVLGIGAGAVHLALTHRHFRGVTMSPVPPAADDSSADGDSDIVDSTPAIESVRGEIP
jgi:hypothetical protein